MVYFYESLAICAAILRQLLPEEYGSKLHTCDCVSELLLCPYTNPSKLILESPSRGDGYSGKIMPLKLLLGKVFRTHLGATR
jgi:hypothetical protein